MDELNLNNSRAIEEQGEVLEQVFQHQLVAGIFVSIPSSWLAHVLVEPTPLAVIVAISPARLLARKTNMALRVLIKCASAVS